MVKVLTLCLLFFISLGLTAADHYRMPPPEVTALVDAPPPPVVTPNPDGTVLLVQQEIPLVHLADLAAPQAALAGLRFFTRTRLPRDTIFVASISFVHVGDGRAIPVTLPEGSRLWRPQWSFDGRRVAFGLVTAGGVELWTAAADDGSTRRVLPAGLHGMFQGWCWMPGSRRLLLSLTPSSNGAPPAAPDQPYAPWTVECSGKTARLTTFPDLLRDDADENLFEYYAASRLALLDLDSGALSIIGPPGIYTAFSPSPDGRYILVNRLRRPFSHTVPWFFFARAIEVWDERGRPMRVLADLPAVEEMVYTGVRPGPREVGWQAMEPATLVWVEALDGGDAEKEVPFHDRLCALAAPFTGTPRVLLSLPERFRSLHWLGRRGRVLVHTIAWKTKWVKGFTADLLLSRPHMHPLFAYNVDDDYHLPGEPLKRLTDRGETVAVGEGEYLYLNGEGASPQGDRPFLDRLCLRDGRTVRLFRCGGDRYEKVLAFAGRDMRRVILRREDDARAPAYFLLDTVSAAERAITAFPEPVCLPPGVHKQLVRYTRADGVPLSGMLYLPPGRWAGERLPLVIWAYPLEYTETATAGQVRGSPHRFTVPDGASPLYFLARGYAVLFDAQMPVVGDPKTMNDTYIEQVTAAAAAAVDALDAMGIVDRRRVGIGGHSYGAFTVANLLAHGDLFAAGIARSGAYNRTLTPFGFQNERRSLWQARDVYLRLSPFLHADRLHAPLLLIHGADDENTGTFPLQSERMFHALQGFGATARLVLLPREGHHYRARESVLHVLAEMFEWFDRYVRDRR